MLGRGVQDRTNKTPMKTLPVNILPRYAPSKRLRYEKQTEAPNPFRLLLVEVLHRGKVLENEECRKKSFDKRTSYLANGSDMDRCFKCHLSIPFRLFLLDRECLST
jgi:hypothetical protein